MPQVSTLISRRNVVLVALATAALLVGCLWIGEKKSEPELVAVGELDRGNAFFSGDEDNELGWGTEGEADGVEESEVTEDTEDTVNELPTWAKGEEVLGKALLETAKPVTGGEELSIQPGVVLRKNPVACYSHGFYPFAGLELRKWGFKVVTKHFSDDASFLRECDVSVKPANVLGHVVPPGHLHSQLGAKFCVTAGKSTQLECRRNLAKDAGCRPFETYGVQPRTFDLTQVSECKSFLDAAERSSSVSGEWWLVKPSEYDLSHGIGQKLLNTAGVVNFINSAKGGGCVTPKYFQVQTYITQPLLIKSRKFDLRTFVVVARSSPFLLFQAPGFMRLAALPFSMDTTDIKQHITNSHEQDGFDDHFGNFSRVQELLNAEGLLEPDFMTKRFLPRAAMITRYMFFALRNTAKYKKINTVRRYNVYGLDWVIDSRGNSQLLEGNAKPQQKNKYLGTGLFREGLRLALTAQLAPRALIKDSWEELTVARKYRFGSYQLILNELEENRINNASARIQEEDSHEAIRRNFGDICGLLESIDQTWVGPKSSFLN